MGPFAWSLFFVLHAVIFYYIINIVDSGEESKGKDWLIGIFSILTLLMILSAYVCVLLAIISIPI
jgi:hypothetical protein